MKRTVFCHFFNEEYLLPWWLNHHKQYFDHGVMVNYGSWDRSVDIIREICPTWEIVDSRHEYFSYPNAGDIDVEIAMLESKYQGWKACLNVTEFLVGDYRLFDTVDYDLQVKQVLFVDEDREQLPTYDKPLWEQKINGIDYDIANTATSNVFNRHARVIHKNSSWSYPEGRHYQYYNTDRLAIFYYAWSPWNIRMKMRRLQTGAKMHPSALLDWKVSTVVSQTGFGRGSGGMQQYPHNMYPPYALENIYNEMKEGAKPQSDMINHFIELMTAPKEDPRPWNSEYDMTRHTNRGRFYKHTSAPDNQHEMNKKEERENLVSKLFDPVQETTAVEVVKHQFVI